MSTVAFILLACLGQFPFYGDIPETVPTFKMTFSDGAVSYGALALDGNWLGEAPSSPTGGKVPTIIYDTPWSPHQDRPIRQPECVLETLSLRKKRLAEEWKQNGYAPVQTAGGEYYAPSEEIKLAKRAQEMEAGVAQVAVTAINPAEVSAPPPPAPEPGFLERWGMHAAVLGIGLTASFIIFRKMVMGE